MTLAFTKMHGLGNDFIVIDARTAPFEPDPQALSRLCDRRHGVGCDQVLVLEPPRGSDTVAAYRVYNADGSRAGQCGNGVRCLARWLRDRGEAPARVFSLEGPGGAVSLECLDDSTVKVNMGAPRLAPADIPLGEPHQRDHYVLDTGHGQIQFGAVSMGNPHAVVVVDDVDDAPVRELAALLEADPRFPEGVNVGFLEVRDPGHVRLRVHERGAGETLACGTGACAAAVCGIRWGLLDVSVIVALPGGELTVQWTGGEAPVWMTGPAVQAFEGRTEL